MDNTWNCLSKIAEKKETKSDSAGCVIKIEHKWSLENIAEQGNVDTGAILETQDMKPRKLIKDEFIAIN